MNTIPAEIKTPRKNPPNKIPSVDNDVDPGASDNINKISNVNVDDYLYHHINNNQRYYYIANIW